MIRFSYVSKRYPQGRAALSQISFHLAEGEMAFVIGHSGAGKTTLLKLVMLMERCTQGQVFVQGRNLNCVPYRQIPYLRRRIGMISQGAQLLLDRSVFDNVAVPLLVAGYRRQEIERRVHAALDKVGLLSRKKTLPVALSAGEQQRVSIARAVVHKPMLLLADEPTGNLDPKLSEEIIQLLTQFSQVGTTVLIATHDVTLATSMRRRMLVLEKGHLVQEGA